MLHFHLFCFLLFPAGFQFFQSVFAGQADLAVLDVHDLYDNGITYGNHVLYLFYPFLVQLGDMYQTVASRCNFYKGTERLMETTLPL